MISKQEFVEYMQVFKNLQDKELDLYNATDGAFDLLNLEEYHDLTEKYIDMVAELVECDIEDLWYFIGECELGKNIKTIEKNGTKYVLGSFEQAYDWLISEPELCDCFMRYFTSDGKHQYGRCIGTKERDICDCEGNRNKCNFYTFDADGHSHIK